MLGRIRVLALLVVAISGLPGCGGGSGAGNQTAPVNSRPNAVISVGATTGHSPFAVTFDASQSADSDGSISSYNWDFGDGTSAQTIQVAHTYTDLDIFSATLTVTDDDGATATTSVSIKVHAQVAGYYIGSIWSDVTLQQVNVEVIVGTNFELYAWDYINYDSVYWGNYDISSSIVSGTLNAEIWNPALTFVDGTQRGSITVSADVAARQSISGTYSGVGDTGPLDVAYLPEISDAPLTIAEISGTWSYSDGLGYSESMSIATDGMFNYSASVGCTANGQITELDTTINIYEFEYNLFCPPGVSSNPNGVRAGLAFVDNYWYAESWLVMAGAVGNFSTQLAVSRPLPVAATKSDDAITAAKIGKTPSRNLRSRAR